MNTKTQLHQAYIGLKINKKLSPQNRGFEFERLLFQLFELEKLKPSKSYRAEGEQTDGMFKYEGNYYLLEAKWMKEPISASHLLTLSGKVSGKFIGTRGVFLSMSNFSNDAPNILRYLPHTNILLFDRDDIDYCFSLEHSFEEVLETKLRYAARVGKVNYPFKQHLNQQKRQK